MRNPAIHLVLTSSLLAAVSFSAAEAAAAAAVVRAAATPVLESAEPSAKVLNTLAEGTKLDVSDAVTNGRRRIKLPSGQDGFVDDAAVELVKDEAVAKKPERPQPAACPVQQSQPRMPMFVEDWGHLAELTKSDPDVFARAELMGRRQSGASLLAHLGIGVGLGMIGLGAADRAASGEWSNGMNWLVIAGAAAAVISGITAWNYAPDRGDMANAVNLWNRRHPDKPLAP
jgi:hypothetical protein